MKRIISFIIDGCWHKWLTLRGQTIVNNNGNIIGSRFIHQCTKCGKIIHEDHV